MKKAARIGLTDKLDPIESDTIMSMSKRQWWQRYNTHLCRCEEISLQLDISRMNFPSDWFAQRAPQISRALDAMEALEHGALANADEHRTVGHYWLRSPELAPSPDIKKSIEASLEKIHTFTRAVHRGSIHPPGQESFMIVLAIGIGGSALGPQLLTDALGTSEDLMVVDFIDNTDPNGIARILDELEDLLGQVLVVVSSKSGATIETQNARREVVDAFNRAGLDFAKQAVAITTTNSPLDQLAKQQGWLGVFPIWDWVGGRTSITSAVGLLPASLQGLDVEKFLAGARQADVLTRCRDVRRNPAALLALMWEYAGKRQHKHTMIVLPYADKLALFGKYLQQLIMESIGKATNRQGQKVHEGLTVLGNKGTTDQHAILQQLQEGPNEFFAIFIQVLHHGGRNPANSEPREVTSGDFLNSFLLATRESLFEADRESITISLSELTPYTLGALVALFERAVGLYAELIDVNAYHQPGVEASKQAVARLVELQSLALTYLRTNRNHPQSAEQIGEGIGCANDVESVYHLLVHLAANHEQGIETDRRSSPDETTFWIRSE